MLSRKLPLPLSPPVSPTQFFSEGLRCGREHLHTYRSIDRDSASGHSSYNLANRYLDQAQASHQTSGVPTDPYASASSSSAFAHADGSAGYCQSALEVRRTSDYPYNTGSDHRRYSVDDSVYDTPESQLTPGSSMQDRLEDGDSAEEDEDDQDEANNEEVELTPAQRLSLKRKMKRFRLTHSQTRFLMNEFAKQAHPDAAHRERLAREIPGLSVRQVQVWFQNRRAKLKRLTVEDQERMTRSRALPADFDMSQSLHSPFDQRVPMTGMPTQPSTYGNYEVSGPVQPIASYDPMNRQYQESNVLQVPQSGYSMQMQHSKPASLTTRMTSLNMASERSQDSPMQPAGMSEPNNVAPVSTPSAQNLATTGGIVQSPYETIQSTMLEGINNWAVQPSLHPTHQYPGHSVAYSDASHFDPSQAQSSRNLNYPVGGADALSLAYSGGANSDGTNYSGGPQSSSHGTMTGASLDLQYRRANTYYAEPIYTHQPSPIYPPSSQSAASSSHGNPPWSSGHQSTTYQ